MKENEIKFHLGKFTPWNQTFRENFGSHIVNFVTINTKTWQIHVLLIDIS